MNLKQQLELDLFPPVNVKPLSSVKPCEEDPLDEEEDQAIKEAMDHIQGIYDFRIDLNPKPTPRPRASARMMGGKARVMVYNPSEYTEYKKQIAMALRVLKVPKGEYSRIYISVHMPYPKSVKDTKKETRRVDGAPHLKKPDWDNYVKGIQDAMGDAGIIKDDGGLSDGMVKKRYTIEENGFIQFSLR